MSLASNMNFLTAGADFSGFFRQTQPTVRKCTRSMYHCFVKIYVLTFFSPCLGDAQKVNRCVPTFLNTTSCSLDEWLISAPHRQSTFETSSSNRSTSKHYTGQESRLIGNFGSRGAFLGVADLCNLGTTSQKCCCCCKIKYQIIITE